MTLNILFQKIVRLENRIQEDPSCILYRYRRAMIHAYKKEIEQIQNAFKAERERTACQQTTNSEQEIPLNLTEDREQLLDQNQISWNITSLNS